MGSTTTIKGTTTAEKVVTISDITDATATTDGALVVSGGVGIAKKLFVGDKITAESAIDVAGVGTFKNTASADGGAGTASVVIDGGMLVKPSADGSRPGYAPKTGWKEETEKFLRWLENNRDSFDFANSSSADVLKASKVDLGIGTIQKYLAEEGIQTNRAISRTQDTPKYTKKVLAELKEGLPKGISLEKKPNGKYHFRIMLKGGKAGKKTYRNSMVANEPQPNSHQQQVKGQYPVTEKGPRAQALDD